MDGRGAMGLRKLRGNLKVEGANKGMFWDRDVLLRALWIGLRYSCQLGIEQDSIEIWMFISKRELPGRRLGEWNMRSGMVPHLRYECNAKYVDTMRALNNDMYFCTRW